MAKCEFSLCFPQYRCRGSTLSSFVKGAEEFSTLELKNPEKQTWTYKLASTHPLPHPYPYFSTYILRFNSNLPTFPSLLAHGHHLQPPLPLLVFAGSKSQILSVEGLHPRTSHSPHLPPPTPHPTIPPSSPATSTRKLLAERGSLPGPP